LKGGRAIASDAKRVALRLPDAPRQLDEIPTAAPSGASPAAVRSAALL
jgi:hypothetical protein